MKNQFRFIIAIFSFILLQSHQSFAALWTGTLSNPPNYSTCTLTSHVATAQFTYQAPCPKVILYLYKYDGSGDINDLGNYSGYGSSITSFTNGTFINFTVSASGYFIVKADYFYKNGCTGSIYTFDYSLLSGQYLSGGVVVGSVSQFYQCFEAAAVSNFTINGTAASCTSQSVYNCVAINLGNTSTGSSYPSPCNTNFKYRIFIYNSTSSCTQSTAVYSNGSNPITTNPSYTTTALSTVDLRALPGFQGNWLSQAQNHTGYFLVKLEVTSDCNGASSVKTALINVSGPPTAASLSLVLNKGNGATYGLDQTPPVNNPSGCYGGGINIANSTGVITYYDSQIDKINCTTGAFISSIGSHHENTPSGVSSLTAISYSFLTSGYFGAHCLDGGFFGTCYKISVTVGNACGTDNKWSYFSIDGAYREGSSSSMATQTINAYPNPSDNIFNFDFEIGQRTNCYLNIYDQAGKLVGRILNGEPLEAGNYTFSFDANHLSSGMYYYQLIADNVKTGSIVKLGN